ncbi:MAG: hypothetical protein ACFFG0_54730, partial [Candidatus Thorarchaeota archaeon]
MTTCEDREGKFISEKEIKESNIPFARENIPFERLFNPSAVVVVGVSKGRGWGGTHYLETFKEYAY